MARIRSIKPDWAEDEKLTMCTEAARVLSVDLILWSDDYGRGRLGPERSRACQAFPRYDDPVPLFRSALAELAGWFVGVYSVDGQAYFSIVNWSRHQRVDHPGAPLCPEPPAGWVASPLSSVPPSPLLDARARDPDPDPDPDLDPDLDPDQSRKPREDSRESRESLARGSREPREGLASIVRTSTDLTPFLPDLTEAQRVAWDMRMPPPPPEPGSDDLERLVEAFHDGEQLGPGKGMLRILAAVRGHASRQRRPGADRRSDALRFAWPPVFEGGKANWRKLDKVRFHELVEEGARKTRERVRAQGWHPLPEGMTCGDCDGFEMCKEKHNTLATDEVCKRPNNWFERRG